MFEELNPDILAQLNDNPDLLQSVLQSHVVEGAYGILDLRNAAEGSIVTLNGDPLEIDLGAGGLKIDGADLVSTDVENTYSNGVLNQVGDLVLSASLRSQLGISDTEEATSDPGVFGGTFADYDANADGVLTPDELDAGVYTRYDANQDGIIDQTEYDTNPGLFGGAFADFDADGSGDLNQDEYRGAYDNAGVFDSLDADGSGDVSQEEYDSNRDLLGLGAAGAAVTGAAATVVGAGNQVAQGADYTTLDANADGSVTEEEFAGGYDAGLFGDYDTNGDGVITEDEFNAYAGEAGMGTETGGAAMGAETGGAETGGAETGGAETGGAETGGAQMFDGTVVELLTNDGRFGTLLTAITDAGLLDSLQQQAPFTLFAPTDDAFVALPDAERESILGDTDMLTNLLLYHVVPGKVMAADLVGTEPGNTSANAGEVRDGQAATLEGSDLSLAVEDNGVVSVNNGQATVVEADLEASDGVVHVINGVLIPESMMNQ